MSRSGLLFILKVRRSVKKILMGVVMSLALLGGMVVGGCQTGPMMSSSADMMKYKYVIVTPGNGPAYTIAVPVDHPDDVQIIGKAGTMACAQCVKDAKAYALTGMLDPVCKECGAHREMAAMAPTSGHN